VREGIVGNGASLPRREAESRPVREGIVANGASLTSGFRRSLMQPDEWEKVKELSRRPRAPPAARASFLRESCGADNAFAQEVESLLAVTKNQRCLSNIPSNLATQTCNRQPQVSRQTFGAYRF